MYGGRKEMSLSVRKPKAMCVDIFGRERNAARMTRRRSESGLAPSTGRIDHARATREIHIIVIRGK